MKENIKIIIADDNVAFCDILSKFLQDYEDIEILGKAYDDMNEIKLIEGLKPDIVITDLMRNHLPTGADIIKKYNKEKTDPKFFVITADRDIDYIKNELKAAAVLNKPFLDYKIIPEELRRIKSEIKEIKNEIIIAKTKDVVKIGFFNKIFDLLKIRK